MRVEVIRVARLGDLPEGVPPADVGSRILLVTGAERPAVEEIDPLARRALLGRTETIATWGPHAEWIHDVIDETHVEMWVIEGTIGDDRVMMTNWATRPVDALADLTEAVRDCIAGHAYCTDDAVSLGWIGIVLAGCDEAAAGAAAEGLRPAR